MRKALLEEATFPLRPPADCALVLAPVAVLLSALATVDVAQRFAEARRPAKLFQQSRSCITTAWASALAVPRVCSSRDTSNTTSWSKLPALLDICCAYTK